MQSMEILLQQYVMNKIKRSFTELGDYMNANGCNVI